MSVDYVVYLDTVCISTLLFSTKPQAEISIVSVHTVQLPYYDRLDYVCRLRSLLCSTTLDYSDRLDYVCRLRSLLCSTTLDYSDRLDYVCRLRSLLRYSMHIYSTVLHKTICPGRNHQSWCLTQCLFAKQICLPLIARIIFGRTRMLIGLRTLR